MGSVPGKDLLARLNPAQSEAVCLGWGPSLVIAGAGSGKTTVLTRRIAFLIKELRQDPETVLAVTFTNKAAAQMKHRVEEIVGWEYSRRITIGTFHSICARLLRREIDCYESPEGFKLTRNFVIYDESDSLSIMKGVVSKLNLDEKVFVPKEMRYAISALKNDGYTAHLFSQEAKTYRDNKLSEIFNTYQAELTRNNAMDFDDLILIFSQLLKQRPDVLARQRERFKHILVDEFQDTNRAQYDLVRALAEPAKPGPGERIEDMWNGRSLMVVGDVDQSIYSWRKADYRIILGFREDFKEGRLIKLEENYRSTETILEVANSIISNNTERIEKVLRCNRGKGGKVQCFESADEIDEAYYVVEEIKRLQMRGRPLSDCLILYRTNAQSRAVEEVLVRNHIPYTVIGATRFYERQEIKDVLAYIKLVYNPQDGQSFNRIINVPRRGLGKTSLDRLNSYAEDSGISPLDAAREAHQIRDLPPKAVQGLREFASMVDRWRMLSQRKPSAEGQGLVCELIETILKETRYVEKLEEDANSSRDELAMGRIENIREFLAVAKEFDSVADEPDLDSFLTRISLVSDLDSVREDQPMVTLMTLHSAKGLEYPVVFLVGLEEGLFPHIRSLDSPSALEEERRLMYVGVTRAMDALYITLARKRMLIGRGPMGASGFTSSYTIPSRFLREIAPGLLSGYYPAPSTTEERITEMEATGGFRPGGGSSYQNGSRYGSEQSRYGSQNGSRYGSDQSRYGSQNGSPNSPPSTPAKPRAMRMQGPAPANPPVRVEKPSATPVSFERLSVGDTVEHAKFGVGTVVQVIGEKDKELYNVEFRDAGKRLLDPRFAKLVKI